MKSPDSPKALVIGGSLGGLFAATALRAIGWQVDVFERSPRQWIAVAVALFCKRMSCSIFAMPASTDPCAGRPLP
jgi:2-polyprenyl-6-methoxyphenol hydroxylase-like FAD-dependent oxidoreductase